MKVGLGGEGRCSPSPLLGREIGPILANVVVRPSVCRLSSVTFVHPTQVIEIFGNVSTPFGTLEPLRRNLAKNQTKNQRGIEKCSDFGPFQGYISETVKDRR